jgi:hypothetical protein
MPNAKTACPTGKKMHETRKRAKQWVRSRVEVHKVSHQRVYKCPHCGLFHVTSYTAEEAERIRSKRGEGGNEAIMSPRLIESDDLSSPRRPV